jgi:hypothetical protein
MSVQPLQKRPIPVTQNERLKNDENCSKKRTVILQPLAIRIPNRYGVYSPSKLEPQKEISYQEFLSRYADYPRKIRVCLDETPSSETLLQKSEWFTAYSFGLDCWYVVVTNSPDNE